MTENLKLVYKRKYFLPWMGAYSVIYVVSVVNLKVCNEF